MNETPSATAILAPIWRRKWLILLVAIVVAGGAYVYYKRKPTSFRAETKLYLNAGSEESGGEKAIGGKGAASIAGAQPELINSVIAESVHRLLKKEHNHAAKVASKGKVKAKAAEKSQFVNITTEARTGKGAALLANTVAQTYIKRQHLEYERGILSQLVIAHRQLRRIEASSLPVTGKGKSSSSLASSQGSIIREAQLNSHINQLEAELGVQQVQQLALAKAGKAELLGPKPKRNAEFGFVIGLVIASIVAFVVARFNRRLRTLADVEAIFHTQILTALPTVRRPVVDRGGYPEPSRFLIEPLRRLRTTLMLNGASRNGASANEHKERAHSILFLSADAGDGRSTVVADFALVQREAGERTVILDADFRRPRQARLLGLSEQTGLVEVLSGALTPEEALQTVPAALQPELLAGLPRGGGDTATALASREEGAVVALPARAAPVNPPALLGGPAMGELLRSLGRDYDHVLIDVPSPLEFSDAMPLLGEVDAIVLVARVGHTRERSADRLRQLLARTPSAPILGVVANAVAPKDIERYGIATGGGQRGWLARLTGR